MPLPAVRGEPAALVVAPDIWEELVEEAPGAGRPRPRAGIEPAADAATADDTSDRPEQGAREKRKAYGIAVGTGTAQQGKK